MTAPHGKVWKSIQGIPHSLSARGVDLAKEARLARSRFYPVTLIYGSCAALVVFFALRSHAGWTLFFLALALPLWSWLEYVVHRHVLHGRFPEGPGRLQHALHVLFDPIHGSHHLRPWDGMYVNGYFSTAPFAAALLLASFLAPIHTLPALVAGLLVAYVAEEWVHYSVHFHRFRLRYFDYIRRHHLYHHSPRCGERAFGLTNGIWDVLAGTRIPEADRKRLYRRHGAR